MRFNYSFEGHKEIMKDHEKRFNRIKERNKNKRENIQKSINQKLNNFEGRKKERASEFNLIRNRQL